MSNPNLPPGMTLAEPLDDEEVQLWIERNMPDELTAALADELHDFADSLLEAFFENRNSSERLHREFEEALGRAARIVARENPCEIEAAFRRRY